jgi:predicted transcriptional regulator
MSTAETIKKLRRTLCITQKEMSEEIGVTISTISCYEVGRRLPSYPTVRKIIALAKKYNINISLDDIRPE